MNFKFKKLKKIKPQYLFILLITGVALLLFSNLYSEIPKEKGEKTDKTESSHCTNDATALESRLAAVVEKISGVTDAEVFVTYENSGIKKHAIDAKDDATTSDESVTVKKETSAVMEKHSSNETPFISEEVMPQVRGVLIVAGGIKSSNIKDEIAEAVSAVLDVPVHKVKVLSAD